MRKKESDSFESSLYRRFCIWIDLTILLGERHLQERQQMLKHQLKATFLMQKHQMHWRHEKETEQLRKYQAKKMADFEKELDAQRRLMPKV